MAKRVSHLGTAFSFIRKLYYGFAVDFGGPLRSLNLRVAKAPVFFDSRCDVITGNRDSGTSILSGTFTYQGQSIDVGAQGDPWSIALPSESYAAWLHGFHWLPDLLASKDKAAVIRARFLADRWIEHFGKWNAYAWNPDILTHRLYHWLTYWAPALSLDSLSKEADRRRKVTIRQLKRLKATYNRLPQGPIRIKAAVVLALGGLRRDGRDDPFFQKGLDLLDDEINAQVLPDGGLTTRCPADIIDILAILSSLDKLIQARGVEGSSALTRAIDRMQPAVAFFCHPDGRLANFNGSGEGNADVIRQLIKLSNLPERPFLICPNTGYQRIVIGELVFIIDTGGTPAFGYDTRAHLAPLAFELSSEAGRLIVNCGGGKDLPAKWKDLMRQTAAHSTLVLSDMSPGVLISQGLRSELYGPGFSKDVGKVNVARREQAAGVWLEGSHNGYGDEYGLSHRRRIYVNPQGDDIRGEDTLYLPHSETPKTREAVPFDIRFHLHPDVIVTIAQDQNSALLIQKGRIGWRFRTDAGPLRIEKSVYFGQGHRGRETQQLVISGAAFGDGDGETDTNRVRWSIRRIQKTQSLNKPL